MHLLLSSFFIITKLINLNYLNIQFEGEGILFSLCVNKSSCMTIKKKLFNPKKYNNFFPCIYIFFLLK